MLRRLVFLALCWTSLGGLVSPRLAQKKPKENAQVLVGVKLGAINPGGYSQPSATDVSMSARLYSSGDGATLFGENWSAPGSGTQYDASSFNVLMTPGKQYEMTLNCGTWQSGLVK